MLAIVSKAYFEGLHEAGKQLVNWNFCKNFLSSRHYYRPRPNFRRKRFNLDDFAVKRCDSENLREIVKDFYVPHSNVVNRSGSDIQSFHKKHNIHLFGNCAEKCPAPIFSFDELNLSSDTMAMIRHMDFAEPTPIQSMTWPIALSGLNMVGIARTGSGKTLGFALPGLVHIKHQLPLERGDGPIVLVISPTRELARQTNDVFLKFARSFSFNTACVYGGSSKTQQMQYLERAHVCIGTPGRLLDFLSSDTTNLRRCSYFVLDEADRLFDMGFEPQIRKIMEQMRPDRQVLLWSATWPEEVQDLTADFMKDFVGVRHGSLELSANPNIKQEVHVCDYHEKDDLLFKILEDIFEEGKSKTLIFAQTIHTVQKLYRLLHRKGYRVGDLHGGKSQSGRDLTMSGFRSGRIDVLVGTGVVGRGLDISDIMNVIIYDFPQTIEDYVHIIGRTGRCERLGTSHTFFTPEDAKDAKALVKLLNETNQQVNPKLLGLVNERYKRRFRYR